MWPGLIIAAQAAVSVGSGADTALPRVVVTTTNCSGVDSAELVVCGRRDNRYRLPLPAERERASDRARGEGRSGLDAITPAGRCGIFAGERPCSKKEAAAYGYGNGRDPITVLGKLVGKVADPDR